MPYGESPNRSRGALGLSLDRLANSFIIPPRAKG